MDRVAGALAAIIFMTLAGCSEPSSGNKSAAANASAPPPVTTPSAPSPAIPDSPPPTPVNEVETRVYVTNVGLAHEKCVDAYSKAKSTLDNITTTPNVDLAGIINSVVQNCKKSTTDIPNFIPPKNSKSNLDPVWRMCTSSAGSRLAAGLAMQEYVAAYGSNVDPSPHLETLRNAGELIKEWTPKCTEALASNGFSPS